MKLRLWTGFSKKSASTKQPSSSYSEIEVYLKKETSIVNPVFIIGDNINLSVNYCYCVDTGRYYYVNDIILINNNHYELVCSIDVLATYRSQIGASTFYVERASHEYNKYFIDGLVSAEQINRTELHYIYELGVEVFNQTGCFLVRVQSQSIGSATGVNTYVMTRDNLRYLLNYAFDYSHYGNEFQNVIVKSVFNPFDYIIDIKWTPIDIDIVRDAHGTSQIEQAVKLGYWTTDAMGYFVPNSRIVFEYTADLSNVDYRYDDFRNFDPRFTQFKLRLPAYGVIDLPANLMNTLELKAQYSVDVATGQTRIYVTKDNGQPIITLTGNVMAQLQLAQSSQNVGDIVGDALSVVGSVASENFVGTAFSIIDVARNIIQPAKSTLGNPGVVSALRDNMKMHLYVTQVGSGDIPLLYCGRPLMAHRQVSNIPGYIKCGNASIDLNVTDVEREQINAFLNGGFYYE